MKSRMNGRKNFGEIIITGFDELANNISSIRQKHPLRICIDGVTASGKTTFSKKLANKLNELGQHTITVSLDDFHNLKAIRYKDGRNSPSGYYNNAYNIEGIIEFLLKPISIVPEYKYISKLHDIEKDIILSPDWINAKSKSILIVDGSFSLRKELRPYIDFGIYLDVDFSISENRAVKRDESLFGSKESARKMTKDRYQAAHKIHLEENDPKSFSHIIVMNNDPLNPLIKINRSYD